MSFPDFLDISYTLLAEEQQRINPLQTLEKIAEEFAARAGQKRPVPRANVEAQNEQSLAQLNAMMRGVQKRV